MRDRIKIIGIINALLMAVALLLLSVTVVVADNTSPVQITLEAPDEVDPDSDFTVTVNISQVENLDSASFYLNYNATLATVSKVEAGKIGNTALPLDIKRNLPQENQYIILTNFPGIQCTSGAGYLAIFHFKVIGAAGQNINLSFSNSAIVHCGGATAAPPSGKIPSTWMGKTIHIAGETPSEPSESSEDSEDSELSDSSSSSQQGGASYTGGTQSGTTGVASSPPVLLAPSQGVTDISDYVTAEGKFGEDIAVKSNDGAAELAIRGGTVGLTGEKSTLEQIGVYEMSNPPRPSADYRIAGKVFEMGPDGATFNPPLTLTISYAESDIPLNVDESALTIAYWDTSAERYVVLDSFVDEELNTVTAEVLHFTVFGILASLEEASATSTSVLGESVTPSPAPVTVQQAPLPSPSVSLPSSEAPAASQEAPVVQKTSAGISWWLLVTVIVGIAAVAIALVFCFRRRRSLR